MNPDMKTWFWRKSSTSRTPSQVPIILDAQWIDGWPQHADVPPPSDNMRWSDGNNFSRFVINRHTGYVNAAFMDGTARKVGLKQMWTLKWHKNFNTKYRWTVAGGVERDDWPEWMRGFKDF